MVLFQIPFKTPPGGRRGRTFNLGASWEARKHLGSYIFRLQILNSKWVDRKQRMWEATT